MYSSWGRVAASTHWRGSSPSRLPLKDLHAAPGSPGIAPFGECHPIRAEDKEGILELARFLDVDLVVVGPEAPLVDGLADVLRPAGITVFGPSAAAARIEGSKAFAKEVMAAAEIPTAAPASGRAAALRRQGRRPRRRQRGVIVCETQEELDSALLGVTALGGSFLVEELLAGPEISVLAVCDGRDAVALASAQDYKRAFDGDRGPNTGGMGTYAPVPGIDGAAVEELLETVHRPALRELAGRGRTVRRGAVRGLMLTSDGPRVLEFNCRFGDPETQSVLALLEGDLTEALASAGTGELAGVRLAARPGAAVTVVLAAGGYPEAGDRGSPIRGVEDAEASRRARVPRRHGAERNATRHERRSRPRRHRPRGHGRDARERCVWGRRPDLVRGRPPPR